MLARLRLDPENEAASLRYAGSPGTPKNRTKQATIPTSKRNRRRRIGVGEEDGGDIVGEEFGLFLVKSIVETYY